MNNIEEIQIRSQPVIGTNYKIYRFNVLVCDYKEASWAIVFKDIFKYIFNYNQYLLKLKLICSFKNIPLKWKIKILFSFLFHPIIIPTMIILSKLLKKTVKF